MPGVIDTQVHFREPGLEWKEDLETGSRAAVLGGVVAVFEMPNTEPTTTDPDALADKLSRAAGRMHCDHAFYVGGTHENAQWLGELERLPGCCGIKVFMGASTGTLLVQDDEGIEQVLRHVNRRRPSTPRTNTAWPTAGRWPAPATGPATTRSATPSRRSSPPSGWCGSPPRWASASMCCTSTTADEIAYLAAHKDVASVELTPQHLTLAGPEAYERLKGYAQMNPPIRGEEHRAALWAGLASGVADVLGSDHAPHTSEEKARPYPASPSGMPRADPAAGDADPRGRGPPQPRAPRRPDQPRANRLFGLADKGRLAEGFDADLTIVDLKARRTIAHAEMASRVGWTPFDGMQAKGWPMATIIRGRIVMRDDEVIAPHLGEPVRFAETLAG